MCSIVRQLGLVTYILLLHCVEDNFRSETHTHAGCQFLQVHDLHLRSDACCPYEKHRTGDQKAWYKIEVFEGTGPRLLWDTSQVPS